MGWARGSEIADTIWELVRSHIPASEKKNIAIQLIDIFEMEDADDFNGEMEICKDADMYQDEEWPAAPFAGSTWAIRQAFGGGYGPASRGGYSAP